MRGWIICFQNPVISGSCYLFSSTHIHQQVSTKLTLNGHCATFVAIKFAGANSNVTHKAAERLSLGCFGRVDQGSSQVTQTHIKSSFDTQLFGYMIYIYIYGVCWSVTVCAYRQGNRLFHRIQEYPSTCHPPPCRGLQERKNSDIVQACRLGYEVSWLYPLYDVTNWKKIRPQSLTWNLKFKMPPWKRKKHLF